MPVHVKLSTTLRDSIAGYNPVTGIETPLPPGATAGSLAISLGIPMEEVKIIMVNGLHAPSDRVLAEGDRVAYFPAVGGG